MESNTGWIGLCEWRSWNGESDAMIEIFEYMKIFGIVTGIPVSIYLLIIEYLARAALKANRDEQYNKYRRITRIGFWVVIVLFLIFPLPLEMATRWG